MGQMKIIIDLLRTRRRVRSLEAAEIKVTALGSLQSLNAGLSMRTRIQRDERNWAPMFWGSGKFTM